MPLDKHRVTVLNNATRAELDLARKAQKRGDDAEVKRRRARAMDNTRRALAINKRLKDAQTTDKHQ